MVTVKETTERKLETSDEIVAYLAARYAPTTGSARFKAGDPVNITSRAGIPAQFGAGDVAVVPFDVPFQPWTHVLMLNADGADVIVQVPTENLSLRGGGK